MFHTIQNCTIETGWFKKITRTVHENKVFFIFLLAIAVYSLVRLYALTPWYDELYTFVRFIKYGPIHSMSYWPLPNNHVLYSALSALVYQWTHDAFLGLRLVSYISSLINIILVYVICKHNISKQSAITAAILYSAFNCILNQSIQGRGYTLLLTFFLLSVFFLLQINRNKTGKRYFWFYSLSGMLGIYTIPTFVYCLAVFLFAEGIYLLMERQYKRFVKLIVFTAIAGVGALVLYSPIFINHGAIVLQEQGIMNGLESRDVFFAAPMETLRAGINYMLHNNFVMSISFQEVLNGLVNEITGICKYVFISLPQISCIAFLAVLIIPFKNLYKKIKHKQGNIFLDLIILVSILSVLPICLVQKTLPPARVFLYLAVPLAFGFAMIAENIMNRRKAAKKIFLGAACAFLLVQVLLPVNYAVDERDFKMHQIITQLNPANGQSFVLGGEYEDLHLDFYASEKHISIVLDNEKPDYVFMETQQFYPGEPLNWPAAIRYEGYPWEWINSHMKLYYQDDWYTIFVLEQSQ